VGAIMNTVCGILGAKTGEHAKASAPFSTVLAAFFVLIAPAPGVPTPLPRLLMQAGAWAMVRA
jgi:TRAP-type C4-dicarboxylate transport system permease large subunit